jgi:hypothetical protein
MIEFQLYHPRDTSTANPQEQELLATADKALHFLRDEITKDSTTTTTSTTTSSSSINKSGTTPKTYAFGTAT